MINNSNDGRLIWQNHSPLPYESVWSFISKVLLLNSISSGMLVSFIYRKNKSLKPSVLNHRDSNWIDFEKFSNLLGVSEHRLKKGFLTAMGFKTNPVENKPIKYCTKCLEKGFHSVFFDIDVITSCPWHRVQLKKCSECNVSVTRKPLKTEFIEVDGYEWQIRWSKCNHIRLNDREIGKIHSMNDVEIEDIRLQSEALENWLLKLAVHSDLIDELNNAETYHPWNPEVTQTMLSLAISIAGPCPWVLDFDPFPVRSIIWPENDHPLDHYNSEDVATDFTSEFGKTYKAIKNNFFNRYVRQHRRCWQCLTHYSLISAINLDTDTICQVCVAFATWRMVNEGRLKVYKIHKSPGTDRYELKVLRVYDRFLSDPSLNEKKYATVSIEKFSKALYVQFFLIWRALIIERKLIIYHTQWTSELEYFPLLRSNSAKSIIFPSPDYFKIASRQICKRWSREDDFMLIPWAGGYWFDRKKEIRAMDNDIFFKISIDVENIISGKKAHKWLSF
jgi:hypothetical protein